LSLVERTGAPIIAEDLQAMLRAERAKLDRVVVQAQNAGQSVERLEDKVIQLRAEVLADAEEGVLAERGPIAELSARLAQAEAELLDAQQRQLIHNGAIARQKQAIEAIEQQIAARRHERFAAAVAEPEKRMYAAFEEFLQAATEL
jgi:chromosome segregation ATPase